MLCLPWWTWLLGVGALVGVLLAAWSALRSQLARSAAILARLERRRDDD